MKRFIRQYSDKITWIEDPQRAQRLSDGIAQMNWPRILTSFARRVNPLLKDLLRGMDYYWVTDQAEYATDVMFEDAATLAPLYEELVKHATLCFSAEDALRADHQHALRFMLAGSSASYPRSPTSSLGRPLRHGAKQEDGQD